MYPPQLSFIPVSVALARFIEGGGDIWGNYPYWYLGSTPFRYLTGPIVPFLLAGLHKLIPQFSLFDLAYFTLITSLLILSLGWGFFAWQLSNQRKIGVIVGILSLLLPWHWVSSLGLGEVSAVLASALTPWVLLGFSVQCLGASQTQKLNARRYPLIASVLLALLLLTNAVAAIPAVIGLLILAVVVGRDWERGLKRALIVVVAGAILTLWWYTPGYFATILGAPSFGGKSALSTFISLVNSLRSFVPIILAIVLVFWRLKPKDIFQKFIIAWLVLFGTLSLMRFLADFDFWMDWTSWMGEVEVGLALFVSQLVLNVKFQIARGPVGSSSQPTSSIGSNSNLDQSRRFDLRALAGTPSAAATPRLFGVWSLVIGVLLIVAWFFAWQNRNFWLPRTDISQTVEYKTANWLANNLTIQQSNNSPLVFLSGTTAFWLNSLVDVVQVRGGADQAAVHPTWRQSAWEIREGKSADDAEEALKSLKVNYLVVHTEESREFYHDFKNPEKFEQIESLSKIYESRGDIIYKVK